MNSFMISAHHPPLRLDKVLALETGLGLRRCRALIDRRLVLVDGRVLRKGDLVFSGQQISFMSETEAGPEPCWPRPAVSLVARDEHFAVLAKPGGLHTVAGRGPCLENVLPDFGLEGWRLVNRLDCLTSGLVLAARCAKDEAVYKEWQDRGPCTNGIWPWCTAL
jgi:23S rRNA pseudouridine1911/1915/1917 synthase